MLPHLSSLNTVGRVLPEMILSHFLFLTSSPALSRHLLLQTGQEMTMLFQNQSCIPGLLTKKQYSLLSGLLCHPQTHARRGGMGRSRSPEWWGNVWFPWGKVKRALADKGVWGCEEAAVIHLFQTLFSSRASAPESCRFTWGKPLWIT